MHGEPGGLGPATKKEEKESKGGERSKKQEEKKKESFFYLSNCPSKSKRGISTGERNETFLATRADHGVGV